MVNISFKFFINSLILLDQINQVVLNLKALQDAIQEKRQKVSKVEKTKKRIYLEKMRRKEEEMKQRFLVRLLRRPLKLFR
jgi:hypothetical protein